jgi:hypothetical protein
MEPRETRMDTRWHPAQAEGRRALFIAIDKLFH